MRYIFEIIFCNYAHINCRNDQFISIKLSYTRFTISKTHGEQKWLLLALNPEQASIFVSNADTAPT